MLSQMVRFHFLKSSPEDMLIDFREREREGEREGEKHQLSLTLAQTGD